MLKMKSTFEKGGEIVKEDCLTSSQRNSNRISFYLLKGIILLVFILSGCKPAPIQSDAPVKAPVKPVAVYTHMKTPYIHNRIEYQYGVFRISEDWSSYSRIDDSFMFIDFRTTWPDFSKKKSYGKSQPVDRVRLMFEVGETTTPFKNKYHLLEERIKTGIIEDIHDNRFNGLIGYKLKGRNYFSHYQVTDINVTNPMSEPIVIWCSEDNVSGHDMLSKQGGCRYNLAMDSALRIQIRFNKPHLKNFIALHEKVMQLINDIRTVK